MREKEEEKGRRRREREEGRERWEERRGKNEKGRMKRQKRKGKKEKSMWGDRCVTFFQSYPFPFFYSETIYYSLSPSIGLFLFYTRSLSLHFSSFHLPFSSSHALPFCLPNSFYHSHLLTFATTGAPSLIWGMTWRPKEPSSKVTVKVWSVDLSTGFNLSKNIIELLRTESNKYYLRDFNEKIQ